MGKGFLSRLRGEEGSSRVFGHREGEEGIPANLGGSLPRRFKGRKPGGTFPGEGTAPVSPDREEGFTPPVPRWGRSGGLPGPSPGETTRGRGLDRTAGKYEPPDGRLRKEESGEEKGDRRRGEGGGAGGQTGGSGGGCGPFLRLCVHGRHRASWCLGVDRTGDEGGGLWETVEEGAIAVEEGARSA